jgi:DNA-binding NarL/FixJ family response regulator
MSGDFIRVVLIDDHTVLRDGLKLLLAAEPGIRVVGESGTMRGGIAAVEELKPDVAVADVGLPDGDGVEMTRVLRESVPGTRILVLTVHDEDEFILALMQAGVSGYLLKNAAGIDLVTAVRAVAAGKPWLQTEIARRLIELSTGRKAPPPRTGVEALIEPLTPREIEVLKLLAGAATNREIADHLAISTRTVETHLANVYGKLTVRGRTEAMLWAIHEGMVPA